MNKTIDVRNNGNRYAETEISVMKSVGSSDEYRLVFGDKRNKVEVIMTVQQADELRNLMITAGAYTK